jgi:ribosomal protein S12 methylthiotransferase
VPQERRNGDCFFMAEKIGLVSLGCSKNLVDSEQMLYLLDEAGFELTTDLDEADGVIVNTCGFIDEAKQEAIDNILELCEIKNEKDSRLRAVIVTGCLPERYREEIYTEIPEVDAVLGCSALSEIVAAVRGALDGTKPMLFGEKNAPATEIGRVPTTPPFYAYVKISEGCNNDCAYCTIPSIRGTLRSRKEEDIVSECRALAEGGAKELLIIAQDITKYGLDLYGEPRLVPLLKKLCEIDGVSWIRLHYANPDGVTDEFLELIASEEKILKYLDIPIQHISDSVLRKMNRHYDGAFVRELFKKIRKKLPDAVIRTSIIVGHPGEGEQEFSELCEFLRETEIERAGVFTFSPQENTPSAAMEGAVPDEIKEALPTRRMWTARCFSARNPVK